MEYFLIFLLSGLVWEAMKWFWNSLKYKGQIVAGMRVTFSATVPTYEEGQYLLDHILKIRHPQNGSYVMYDVDFKIQK